MKHKPKSNKLFRTWLLIQFCFLAFMALVTVTVYFYTNYHIKKQLDELYISNLKRTEAEGSAVFDSAAAAVNEYIIQPRVRTLAGADLSASERDVARLVDDIKQTNSTVKSVSEIIIYFKNEGMFISSSGVMNENIFIEVYPSSASEEKSKSIINAITNEELIGRVVPVYYGRNDADTAIYTEKSVEDIYVSAIIDPVQIESILLANLQNEQNAYCIFSGDDLLYTLGANLPDAYGLIASKEKQFEEIESLGRGYVYLVSVDNDIKYVSLIDKENYWAGQFRIQRIAIVILGVSIILGAGASYYITKYKYEPVKTVISVSKAITPSHVFASDDNELEQIKNAIEFIYEQKEQAKSVLEDHNIHIKDNAIKMLLDGDIQYRDMTQHVKSLIDITPNTVYSVAVMDIESDNNAAYETVRVKKHVSNAKHIVLKGGRIIMVYEARAKDVMGWLEKQSKEEALQGTIAVGNEGIGEDGIRASYAHALLGLSKKILPDMPRVIPPQDNKEAGAITISAENEIRLGGYIQSGNAEKALTMIKELLAKEHEINNLNYFSYKIYLYNISNVIIRSAESVLSDDTIRTFLDDFSMSFQGDNYQSISKALTDSVVYIAEEYRVKKNSANKRLNTSLVKYIENKIPNPQLSSDMIAEAMNLNSAYLRRFFKEQNGITLWDFINMKRIETARNLLIATNLSIKNISSSCGYSSISTFVRTFKKFSGMTPGHYRNLYR